MAEEEVTYSAVVIKNLTNSPHVPQEEETVYDEVKVREETTEQTANTNDSAGFLPDEKANTRCGHYQHLACCVKILCAILLLGIIVVCVCFAVITHIQLRENQKNQSQEYAALKSKITNLTAENQQLKTENQQLGAQSENLTAKIQDMETQWNELNVSRAQWSVDAYCPKNEKAVPPERKCNSCQEGWLKMSSSCCVFHDSPKPEEWKTWDEAQAACKEKNSELVVVANEEEKKFISEYRWGTAFWIGLRVKDGKWKWLDGSNLTVESWIQKPTAGLCATSVKNQGWESVNCGEKKQWICQKKALSL